MALIPFSFSVVKIRKKSARHGSSLVEKPPKPARHGSACRRANDELVTSDELPTSDELQIQVLFFFLDKLSKIPNYFNHTDEFAKYPHRTGSQFDIRSSGK